jgi:hypothetical protein
MEEGSSRPVARLAAAGTPEGTMTDNSPAAMRAGAGDSKL